MLGAPAWSGVDQVVCPADDVHGSLVLWSHGCPVGLTVCLVLVFDDALTVRHSCCPALDSTVLFHDCTSVVQFIDCVGGLDELIL